MQVEALSQGLANASFLAIPIFLISVSPLTKISILEIIGFTIFVFSIVFETIADYQKLKFLKEMKFQNKKRNFRKVLWRRTVEISLELVSIFICCHLTGTPSSLYLLDSSLNFSYSVLEEYTVTINAFSLFAVILSTLPIL